MATAQRYEFEEQPRTMSEEEYLCTEFEVPTEFIDGVLQEKNVGTFSHSDWAFAIARYFVEHANEWGVRVAPEIHTRTREGHWRIPDVAVFDRNQPLEERLTKPPIAAFEVLSPKDTIREYIEERFPEYEAMGIPHIWLVHPKTGIFRRFQNGNLV